MRLSAEQLSQPISDELPSGEDLEYDPVFQEMEVMMQTTDEQEFGDTIIPGTGPDWKGVAEQIENLNERTRDVRVLTYGALADLSLKGLKVFSESLESLNACLETFWDTIYPELDVDDNNDATMRLNALQILNDYEMVSFGLEKAPLISIKGVGTFSIRDIELAEGKANPVGDEEVHDLGLIQGAFGNADREIIEDLTDGVRNSIKELKRTIEICSGQAPEASLVDFDEILKVLAEIRQAVAKYAPSAAEAIAEDMAEEMGEEQSFGSTAASPVAVSGTVNSRTDVIRMIDKICDYYTANEPSSPIPLLMRRAQRLVPMSFVEILEDMAPDGVEQAQVISGSTDE